MKPQKKPIHKKYIFITLAIVTVGAIAALLAYNHFKPAPTYPLGDVNKLEYIGNTGYGCWLVCDANPAEVYYYATDMSVEEVVGYFKGATKHEILSKIDNGKGGTDYWVVFKTSDQKTFYINYYNDGPGSIAKNQLRKSNKKHIISLSKSSYGTTQGTL